MLIFTLLALHTPKIMNVLRGLTIDQVGKKKKHNFWHINDGQRTLYPKIFGMDEL